MADLEQYRERHEAARMKIPEETFEDYNWAQRVATWRGFVGMGQLVSELLWRVQRKGSRSERDNLRALAPELYDLVLEAFPDEHRTRRRRASS